MKLAMMIGGKVTFIDGSGEVWAGPKKPGEFGVSITTARGMAGFIFEANELRKFVASAEKFLATLPKT